MLLFYFHFSHSIVIFINVFTKMIIYLLHVWCSINRTPPYLAFFLSNPSNKYERPSSLLYYDYEVINNTNKSYLLSSWEWDDCFMRAASIDDQSVIDQLIINNDQQDVVGKSLGDLRKRIRL